MRFWRRWRGLHPVQRWAVRITALIVFLHVAPIQPYIPACVTEGSIFQPPRLRPEAVAETSSSMSHAWWLHVVFSGRIWMAPFQTSSLDFDWWGWQSEIEHLIVRRIASGVRRDGTRFEPPAALIQALAARREEARERRLSGDGLFWGEGMEYRNCIVQRAAFLPD